MKKIAILGMVVLGSAAWATSDNASPNACFGQDRADWIHANGGSTWGAIASTRKGGNALANAIYREGCQP